MAQSREVARKRSLRPVDARMNGRYLVEYRGTTLRVDCGAIDTMLAGDAPTFGQIRELYCRDIYLWPFKFGATTLDTVVDMGGNRGIFTLYASKVSKRVIWIEAQSHYKRSLETALENNAPAAKVLLETAYVIGAGQRTYSQKSKLGSVFRGQTRRMPLSEILSRHGVRSASFMKMDIEGGEFDVFCKPEEWLPRIENLAIEVHRSEGKPEEIVSIMRDCGLETITASAQRKAVTAPEADYIYASRTGALSHWKETGT
jgi:FkbM family methyltransferase